MHWHQPELSLHDGTRQGEIGAEILLRISRELVKCSRAKLDLPQPEGPMRTTSESSGMVTN